MEQQIIDSDLLNETRAAELRDNSARVKLALIACYVYFGMLLVSIISSAMEYSLLSGLDLFSGNFSMDELNANDTRVQILAILQTLFQIGLTIIFIFWFRRAYYNLHLLKVNKKFTDGWASGAWFVPFVNFGRPYVIMRELWENYQNKTNPSVPMETGVGLLGWWWAFWLLGNILTNVSTRIRLKAESIDAFKASDSISIPGDIAHLIALALLVVIIKRISAWEQSLRAPAF